MLCIVQQHVTAEVGISAEDFIRALTGEDYLESGVAHRSAEKEFGNAMAVVEESFGMPDRIQEMFRQICLMDGNREVPGARVSGHLLGDGAFVVCGPVEG